MDGSVPIGKTKLSSGEYSVEISSGSRTLLPFKAVIKPKSTKNTQDLNSDDFESVNINETQNEKLQSDQYQQIGQENNIYKIDETDLGEQKDSILQQQNNTQQNNTQQNNTQESSVQPDVYKTLEQNTSASDNNLSIDKSPSTLDIEESNISSDKLDSVETIESNDQILSVQNSSESPTITDNQLVYRSLQESQYSNEDNSNQNLEQSISDIPDDQIKGENRRSEIETIKTDTNGVSYAQTTITPGASGETKVSLIDNIGASGETKTNITESFGATGEKIVLDSSTNGARGETFVDNNRQFISPSNINQKNEEINNPYRQIGQDESVSYTNNESIQPEDNVKTDNSITENLSENNNRLTFDKMSNTDSSQESENKTLKELDKNTNDNKSIYGALPQQEALPQEKINKEVDDQNNLKNTNLPAGQVSRIQGASGEKTVVSSEFSAIKGQTGVNISQTNAVTGATNVIDSVNQQSDNQAVTSNQAKKLIINKTGVDNQAQTANNYSDVSDRYDNINQEKYIYDDEKSESIRTSAREQDNQQLTLQEQQRPIYKTITDEFGNLHQVDEFGNKITDSDFSYEELQSENKPTANSKSQKNSTIDGVQTEQNNAEANSQFQDISYESLSQATTSSVLGNQSVQSGKTSDQNTNQTQSVYTSLSGSSSNVNNGSKLTKSDNTSLSQSGEKNYNFIQKLSMTINKALGIEPQSIKDEQFNLADSDMDQVPTGDTPARIVSPRVTGLVESKDLGEDEEEDRKNRLKKLRYQRVGYIEPDIKYPEPVKLDDETQAFQDLYGERNRFDTTTSETNSALLRIAEDEIEKQSEAVKEADSQETANTQPEGVQDVESVYYIELMKERARLEQALEDERESNRLAIRKSEDNIQQQLLDLILNNQNIDADSRADDPINKLVQTLITEDKNKNSEQIVIDATRIVQMIQNQITESNGKPIDEYLLRKRIEEELKSEFIYMQKEQEKKMKLVYKKMLEDMYMDMINN